jgi:L-ribulose-5-phosphate 3-epimerase
MILGYNTNGFAHHHLSDALEIMAELGYRGVALTPDVNHFDPWSDSYKTDVQSLREFLYVKNLSCVVETGSRFILDPRRKHYPTLLNSSEEARSKRRSFLAFCMDVISDLRHGDIVSFWSGVAPDESRQTLMARLIDECKHLADHAGDHHVRLAFEPEPGMFIDTMDKFAELHDKVNHPNFGLTLDVGHLVCLNELPISKHIHNWKHKLWNVHLDDMKPGVHDHLMFGEGEVDFNDVFTALNAIDYKGMASVELSRHSYDAVNVARKSMEFLKQYC